MVEGRERGMPKPLTMRRVIHVSASSTISTNDFPHIVHLHNCTDVVIVDVVAAAATATFAATIGYTDVADSCYMICVRST